MAQKCHGGLSDGLCVARQGRIITAEEWFRPETVTDKEFCRHRKGTECHFALKAGLRPMDAATKKMMEIGKEL